MGTGETLDISRAKYTDAEAKAAVVLAGAITNGETKAPTHDAVYDVKVTADAAQPATTDDADAVAAVEAAGLTFAENAGITIDEALSDDGKYDGITEGGVAGTVLAFGDCCHFVAASSRWDLALASSATTSKGKLGMCVLAATATADTTVVLVYGKVRADTAFPALPIGAPIFISAGTAGDIAGTASAGTTDHVVRIIGYGNTADELFFCPDNTYIEIA